MARNYNQGDEPVPGSGYRLVGFLGRGGFGEVWKATAPGGAEAALKIIRLGGTEGRKEFRALQLVKRIRHPNLVPIFAFWLKSRDGQILDDAVAGQDDLPAVETSAPGPLQETMVAPADAGRALATELIIAMGLGDISLFERLEQCRAEGREGIPREELLKYVEDAAKAIDFLNSPLHDLGAGPVAIQHCDIKPHNLMIVGGAVQICDFGLARMMGADRTTTAAATIAYAAPECLVSGRPSDSTDQYSLAVTYYELRTGELPYRDETLATVMDAKREGKLDFSKLSPAERAVLRRATSQNPRDRYPSALEMFKATRRATALGIEPTRETIEYRPRRRGRQVVKTLIWLALLVGLGSAGWVLWPRHGPGLLARVRQLWSRAELPPEPPGPGPQPPPTPPGEDDLQARIDKWSQVIRSEAAGPVKARAYFDRGRCYLQQQAYAEAIADLEQASSLDPAKYDRCAELAEAHFLQGRAYLEQDDYDQAIDEFKLAAAEDPDGSFGYQRRREYAEAHFRRGTSRMAEKAHTEAIQDFTAAMQFDPQNEWNYASRPEYADAYLQQGTDFLKKEDPDQAITCLTEAGKHDASNPLIFVRLAGAWFLKEEYAKVVENLDRALAIEENDMDFLNRGRAHREMDDLDSAIRDFSDAIRLNSGNAAAYACRGEAYMQRAAGAESSQDMDRAVVDLSEAVRLCSQNTETNFPLATAYLWRASCYILSGENELAAKDFQAMIDLDPNNLQQINHEDLAMLARSFATDGQYDKAAQWMEKAVQLAPDASTKSIYRTQCERYKGGRP